MDLRMGFDVRSLRLGLDSLAGFMGFTTLVAEFIGLIAFAPRSLSQAGDVFSPFACEMLAAFTVFVTFVVIHAAAQVIGRTAGLPLLLCAAVGTLAAVMLAVLVDVAAVPLWVLGICYVLACMGAAGTGCVWFVQLCQHEGRMVLGFVAVGVGVGCALCLGFAFMEPVVATGAIAVCSFVSLVLAGLLMRESSDAFTCRIESKVSDKRSRIKAVSTIMLSISFFEFGFVLSFSMQVGVIEVCACAALFAAAALAVDASAGGLLTERSLSPVSPPLTVMAFLLIFMFGDAIRVAALCVLAVICTVYISFGWAAMVQHVRLCKLAPVRVYAKARVAGHGGFMIGIACGFAAAVLPADYGACLGVVVAASFCLLAFFSHKPRFPESGFTPEADGAEKGLRVTWERRCKAVAEKHELSERQQEVLVLMAQGRNARYIENALTISLSTVQTHIRNIYRKLGVHSRQELLDLIEGTKLYGED